MSPVNRHFLNSSFNFFCVEDMLFLGTQIAGNSYAWSINTSCGDVTIKFSSSLYERDALPVNTNCWYVIVNGNPSSISTISFAHKHKLLDNIEFYFSCNPRMCLAISSYCANFICTFGSGFV